MIYAKIYRTYVQADHAIRMYARKHYDNLKKIYIPRLYCVTNDGDEIHFVPEVSFERWSLGRRFKTIQFVENVSE